MDPRKVTVGLVFLFLASALFTSGMTTRYLEPKDMDWLMFLGPSLVAFAVGGYTLHDGLEEKGV